MIIYSRQKQPNVRPLIVEVKRSKHQLPSFEKPMQASVSLVNRHYRKFFLTSSCYRSLVCVQGQHAVSCKDSLRYQLSLEGQGIYMLGSLFYCSYSGAYQCLFQCLCKSLEFRIPENVQLAISLLSIIRAKNSADHIMVLNNSL